MGWRRHEQPERAQSEQSGLSGIMERPLYENPGPSTQAEPIESTATEGPHQSSRIQQQIQRPDNVYGSDPFQPI